MAQVPGKEAQILLMTERDRELLPLSQAIATEITISCCRTSDELFRRLESDTVTHVLLDCVCDFEAAIELLTDVRGENPTIKTAVLAQCAWDSCLSQFFAAGIFNVLDASPGGLSQMPDPAFALMVSPGVAISRMPVLAPDAAGAGELKTWTISDRNSRDLARLQFLEQLHRAGLSEEAEAGLPLIFDELVNNALYHAFRAPDRTEKYSAESFDHMGPDERIVVRSGFDSDSVAVCVTDNAGSLHYRKVAHALVRHSTPEGLLDERGRGLFLTRNLSDRMYVTLVPGKFTQISVCLNRRADCSVKSLQINTA